jgi:hypothetical protein
MINTCPTCKRKFSKLEDYPLIQLINISRRKMPPDMTFPYRDHEIFIKPTSKQGNKEAPKEVLELFSKTKEDSIEHQGWRWSRHKHYDKDDSPSYHRTQINQKETIEKYVNPYLDKLKSLMGETHPIQKILPAFKRDRYFNQFMIPETNYCLGFWENRKTGDYRRTILHILERENTGSAFGPVLTSKAKIASIKYRGLIEA